MKFKCVKWCIHPTHGRMVACTAYTSLLLFERNERRGHAHPLESDMLSTTRHFFKLEFLYRLDLRLRSTKRIERRVRSQLDIEKLFHSLHRGQRILCQYVFGRIFTSAISLFAYLRLREVKFLLAARWHLTRQLALKCRLDYCRIASPSLEPLWLFLVSGGTDRFVGLRFSA
jgi:hypothetical protein